MSADQDDSSRVSPAYRLIHHYRELAMAAVQRYNQAVVNGHVPGTIQRELAESALNYYYALYETRDEQALDEPWEERGIDWLEDAEGKTATVTESLPRANNATTRREKPLLMAIEPAKLKNAILELNDIAKELGLSVQVKESTPRTEITEEMIDDVTEWAEANLPGEN